MENTEFFLELAIIIIVCVIGLSIVVYMVLDGIHKRRVKMVLEKLCNPKAVDSIRRALGSSRVIKSVEEKYGWDLAEDREPEEVVTLCILLADGNDSIRLFAAKALEYRKDPRAIEPLIRALKDPNGSVRANAAMGLAYLNEPCAVEPLIGVLKKDDYILRIGATLALGSLGGLSVGPLLKAFDNRGNTPEYRGLVADALCQNKDTRAIRGLLKALTKDDSAFIYKFASSWMISAEVKSVIAAAIEDNEPEVRRGALLLLENLSDGILPPAEVKSYFEGALEDPDESVRKVVRVRLYQTGGKKYKIRTGILRETVRSNQIESETNYHLKLVIATGLLACCVALALGLGLLFLIPTPVLFHWIVHQIEENTKLTLGKISRWLLLPALGLALLFSVLSVGIFPLTVFAVLFWFLFVSCLFFGLTANPYDWLPVPAVVCLMVIIALPQYGAYLDKKAVSGAMASLDPLCKQIGKALRKKNTVIDPDTFSDLSKAITESSYHHHSINSDGSIIITFLNRNMQNADKQQIYLSKHKLFESRLNGQTLILSPIVKKKSRKVKWDCRSGTLEERLRPAECKQ